MKHPILIVDDERENLNLLVRILGRENEVLEASGADAAIRILKERDVHMILTDQRMPGRSGVELLDEARLARPEAIRILVTAYPDVNVAVDAINRGQVKRYLAKPFDPSELRAIVRQELEMYELAQANRRLTGELAQKVDELVQANEELKELDRLKDHLLANVSHELKTPLVSSMGYLDLLLAGDLGSLAETQEKGVRIAHRNLKRLLILIDDLLVLAKIRSLQSPLVKERIDLAKIVEEEVESLRGWARKESLEVTVEIPKGFPPLEGDESKIRSVLTNVLSNAEKFTGKRARIWIHARPLGPDRCEVCVADNGVGVERAQGPDEFPFFRHRDDAVSKKYGGLGIGLVLSREILAAHGCSIRLEPRKGGGARVLFELPVASSRP